MLIVVHVFCLWALPFQEFEREKKYGDVIDFAYSSDSKYLFKVSSPGLFLLIFKVYLSLHFCIYISCLGERRKKMPVPWDRTRVITGCLQFNIGNVAPVPRQHSGKFEECHDLPGILVMQSSSGTGGATPARGRLIEWSLRTVDKCALLETRKQGCSEHFGTAGCV